jgi:ubiquinol-cytochrome c reductase cytochrome c subunit
VNTLSARRRHPLAAIVVLFLALGVIGATYATLGSSKAKATASTAATPEQLTEGQKLFQSSCSSCHNMNGQGVQGSGPSLIGVGAAAVDFQVGTGRMPAMQIGPQVPSKPPIFTQDQIDAMAAYIGSLGAGPDIPDESAYTADPNSAASVSNGGVLFRTNCSQCHNVAGAGGALTDGKYAPPLRETSPKHIYEAMLTGPQNMPVFGDNQLTEQQKRDIISYIQNMKEDRSQGGWGIGRIGPVTEGLVIFLVGITFLVFTTLWIAGKS